jgi:nucleoside phosphorylase
MHELSREDVLADVAIFVHAAGSASSDANLAMIQAMLSRLSLLDKDLSYLAISILLAVGDERARTLGHSQLKAIGLTPSAVKIEGVTSVDVSMESDAIDLLVVAVKPNELFACMVAFDLDLSTPPTPLGRYGVGAWHGTFSDGTRYSLVMIGAGGTVDAASFSAFITEFIRPKLAVLIGMAAGWVEHSDLGDVIFADAIVDFDLRKQTKTSVVLKPSTYSISRSLVDGFLHLGLAKRVWRQTVMDRFEAIPTQELKRFDIPIPRVWKRAFKGRLGRGVVLAGNTLYEDGSHTKVKKEHEGRLRAVEMEGSGFASACERAGVPYVVARGIADYGESGRDKDWQFIATLNAALAVRKHIEAGYLSGVGLN